MRDRPKDASWHCHLKRKSLASGPDGDIGRFMRGDGGTAADGGSDGRAYHTISGYCPGCRKRVESRAPEQPPAVDLPHGQIGINALATAALLRMQYRLPYRLSTQLLADLPGLTVSPGAVTKQICRMSHWLEGEHDRLRVFLRCAPMAHMDETPWRINGINQWLWTLLDDRHTLFHVDKSRGQKVVEKLLGEVFGGVLVSDFYCGYSKLSSRKQKCLVHLLRELREAGIKSPAFAKGSFCRRLKRLLKEMLLLKKNKPDSHARIVVARLPTPQIGSNAAAGCFCAVQRIRQTDQIRSDQIRYFVPAFQTATRGQDSSSSKF